MKRSLKNLVTGLLAALAFSASSAQAESLLPSLKKGTPEVKSVGNLAFGPEGILFVADAVGGNVFAIDTGDTKSEGKAAALKIEKIDDQIASQLGTKADQILINDLKVNPASGNIYLSVSRGKGPSASPIILKLDRAGKISEFPLKLVAFSKVALTQLSEKRRADSITGLSFVKGKVIVAGLSSEEWASTLRVIPFPFSENPQATGVQIYHGAHGKFETNAPVMTFTTLEIAGQSNVLAAYTCTPLVKFPVEQLKPGEKVKGTTVAELGNRNRPLDMIVYSKDGKEFVLMANSARGVMKIPTEGVDKIQGITERVNGTAGLKYETIESLKGVVQLDKLDADKAVLLVKTEAGFNLETVPLP